MNASEETKARERIIYRVTWLGTVVNLLLTAFKLMAGFWGKSSAMVADGVHSLSDLMTDAVVLICTRISVKPKDTDHDYGHGKYETLATLIIGVTLIVVGAGILYESGVKIWDALHGNIPEKPAMIALIAALISIAFKEGMYWMTVAAGKKIDSKMLVANAWHHRSDSFSSIGTALGISGAIFLGSRWRVLDPIAAVVVSVFILKIAWDLTGPAIKELLESALPKNVRDEALDIIANVGGVSDPHNLRTRTIGNDYAIEAHVRVPGELTVEEAHAIASRIEILLKEKYGPGTHVTIHVEPLKK
jgi:cation diffusion facilitator family transporter